MQEGTATGKSNGGDHSIPFGTSPNEFGIKNQDLSKNRQTQKMKKTTMESTAMHDQAQDGWIQSSHGDLKTIPDPVRNT
jgi:hypothetical protein